MFFKKNKNKQKTNQNNKNNSNNKTQNLHFRNPFVFILKHQRLVFFQARLGKIFIWQKYIVHQFFTKKLLLT